MGCNVESEANETANSAHKSNEKSHTKMGLEKPVFRVTAIVSFLKFSMRRLLLLVSHCNRCYIDSRGKTE
jgi:hypothetical protein